MPTITSTPAVPTFEDIFFYENRFFGSGDLGLDAMSAPPEFLNALVVATAQQDGAAFAELYRLTSPRLFAAARRLMHNEADGREALQDAFLRIWQRADSFDPARGHALQWMGGILRYACVDRLRVYKRMAEVEEDQSVIQLEDTQSAIQIEGFESARNVILDICRCMGGLSATQQQVVLLAVQRGLSHSEISTATGIPLGTVKSVVRRSLAKLRLCLECHDDDAG
jgi:RNA polymerase sigma-70 factor (ECF subfamily)